MQPNIQEIQKEGKAYIQIPKKDYIDMLEDIEDLKTLLQAENSLKKGEEECFPVKLIEDVLNGENSVKLYRKYRELTQQQLSEKSGVNRAYICEIETGKKHGSAKALKAIANALNIDLEMII